ncbi:MAG TPA: AmmeMemoRadiSam system protein B, partial [Bacteroidales bacterium]|nr:AmmeMemoRadiSam system protein B [Bacteroidales bacterium]
MKIRKPAVAGSFYPAYKEELSSVIREMALQQSPLAIKDMGTITGGIIPHAGYIYSGRIALPFFSLLATTGQKFETIIILHPNHYGTGPQIALDTHEAWETPFGITALDLEISSALGLKISADAHRFEHSAEVMLPFLQFFLTHPFKIVP